MSRGVRWCGAFGCALSATLLHATPPAPWRPVPAPALDAALTECLSHLPGDLRADFPRQPHHGTAAWSKGMRAQWKTCTERERDRQDFYAHTQLAADLRQMWQQQTRHPMTPEVAHEADTLAQRLVQVTRTRSAQVAMVGSPLFNNFLSKTGLKSGGFCYEWTRALIQALQPLHFRAFELQWATANIGVVSENNGVLMTARGASFETGLVYDVWRGAGKPYWQAVQHDHYKWYVRLTERQLQMGVADAIEGE